MVSIVKHGVRLITRITYDTDRLNKFQGIPYSEKERSLDDLEKFLTKVTDKTRDQSDRREEL